MTNQTKTDRRKGCHCNLHLNSGVPYEYSVDDDEWDELISVNIGIPRLGTQGIPLQIVDNANGITCARGWTEATQRNARRLDGRKAWNANGALAAQFGRAYNGLETIIARIEINGNPRVETASE